MSVTTRRPHMDKATYYRGVRMMPYDLLKELSIAMIGVLVFVLVLSVALSSPDIPSVTIQSWAKADPVDFVTTATSELAGTSAMSRPTDRRTTPRTASVQTLGFLDPQEWAGIHVATNAANDFVLQPLQQATPRRQRSHRLRWRRTMVRAADQQTTWLTNYTNALAKATVGSDGSVAVPSGDYGPVHGDDVPHAHAGAIGRARRPAPVEQPLLPDRLQHARSCSSVTAGTSATWRPRQNLTGSQWGMMNETGRYPGQAWLWLYTMWYQIPPFNSDTGFLGISAANADLAVVGVMLVLSLLLVLVPVHPRAP